MNAAYLVHGVAPGKTALDVTLPDGSTATAMVDTLEVELVASEGSRHGTITLRFVGAEVAPARELFTAGASITASFAGV